MKKAQSTRPVKNKVQKAIFRMWRKSGKSWAAVTADLGENKGKVFAIANGTRPAPAAFINKLHEHGFKIHQPRAKLPAPCWCGKIHLEARPKRSGAVAKARTDWKKFSMWLVTVMISFQEKV